MTSPTHDHTTHIAPRAAARASAADRVEAALSRLDLLYVELDPAPTTDAGWAARSAVLASLSARRAGWWRVLLVDQRRTHALPAVADRAVRVAYRRARDDFRFWCESAADWQARAEQRPTSDAAGALSNWHELGVTA